MPRDKVVTAEDRQMCLSWRGGLLVAFGTAFLAFLFISLGRFELARPTMVTVAMIGLAITMRFYFSCCGAATASPENSIRIPLGSRKFHIQWPTFAGKGSAETCSPRARSWLYAR